MAHQLDEALMHILELLDKEHDIVFRALDDLHQLKRVRTKILPDSICEALDRIIGSS